MSIQIIDTFEYLLQVDIGIHVFLKLAGMLVLEFKSTYIMSIIV